MLKKIALFLLSVTLFYLLVLLAAGIYINQHKEKLQTYVLQLFKDNLYGEASIRDLDISVWKKFPFVAVTVTDFSLNDSVHHTPVLSASAVSSSFNVFQVFFSGKTIRNINIENGLLHIFTDSAGYSNGYLLAIKGKKAVNDTGKAAGQLNIDRLSIRGVDIIVEDKIKNKEISFRVERLTASISQSGQLASIQMHESVAMKKGLGFNLRKGAWLENQTIEANWDILYDLDAKRLSFTDTKLKINAHPFQLSGYFIFDKIAPSFSIKLASNKLDYNAAKKIVTSAIRQKLDRYDVQQPLDLTGTITGSLLAAHEPIVDIRASTKNNTVHTAFADISNCSFSGFFMNRADTTLEPGDHNSIIRFDGLKANCYGIPVTANTIAITRLDTPFLKMDLHADASLQDVDDKLALKEMAFEKGRAVFDLSYDGPLKEDGSPSIEKVQGTVAIKDATIGYIPRDFKFENCNGIINLFQDSISTRGFTCSLKKNQFTVNIDGSNLRSKMIGADSMVQSVITCSVKSPSVDLGDFTGLFGDRQSRRKNISPEKQFRGLSQKLGEFIGTSIIDINMQAGKIKNQQLTATNFDTHIRFEANRWVLSHVLMNIAGGNISAKGNVTKKTGSHTAVVKIVINHADVKKLLYAFDDFGQQAVTHENLSGNFVTTADLQVGISTAGHIVPASLQGSVDFSLKNGSLERFEPFDRLKTFVFKKRNLNNVQFAEIKDRFDIRESAVYINRMEVQSTAFRLFLEGNYDLYKKATDLLIQVPFSNLNDNSFEGDSTLINKGTSNRKLGNIWLRAVNDNDGKIKVKLTLNRKVVKGKAA